MWQAPSGWSPAQRRSFGTNKVNSPKCNVCREPSTPAQPETQCRTIKDHNESNVNLVWCPKHCDNEPSNEFPPFPFQVYVVREAKSTARDLTTFAKHFACYINSTGRLPDPDKACSDGLCISSQCHICAGRGQGAFLSSDRGDGRGVAHYRFDVYATPMANILACTAHQEREISHRNRNGVHPRLVSNWTEGHWGQQRNRILVIDRDDWTEVGPVSVDYDRSPWFDFDDRPPDLSDEAIILHAERIGNVNRLQRTLREWWVDAGAQWVQADLRRRNNGGFSPAIYPAMDPTAQFDVDHEDPIHELDGTELIGDQGSANGSASKDGLYDPFGTNALYQDEVLSKHLRSMIYSDSFGLSVTSTWDPRLSKRRPAFSKTLYLAFDLPPFEPKALFNCLNKGSIAKEAWTLDVVHNMPSCEAAFDYHTRSSARRRPQKTAAMRTVLSKVVAGRLPQELVEAITDFLLPPDIPYYSNPLTHPFRDAFLYLDSKLLRSGPIMVNCNPTFFCLDDDDPADDFPRYGCEGDLECQTTVLQVRHPRSWHGVADEISTLKRMRALLVAPS